MELQNDDYAIKKMVQSILSITNKDGGILKQQLPGYHTDVQVLAFALIGWMESVIPRRSNFNQETFFIWKHS